MHRRIQKRMYIFYPLAAVLVALFILLLNPGFAYAEETDPPEFKFEVTVTDDGASGLDFYLPTSGALNSDGSGSDPKYGKTYNWNVNWGDNVSDTYDQSASANAADASGIKHSYQNAGTYTIVITPVDSAAEAWLGSFGFSNGTAGANTQSNRNKITSVLSPITPLMTRTAYQISNNLAPSFEWAYTFYLCKNISMGESFTFDAAAWQGITTVGNSFARSMFYGCSGNAFTMNDIFNLPQDITAVGNNFAYYMFYQCSGSAFTMNAVFNLPQTITTVGDSFAHYMFNACSGAAFTMNDVFNFPQGITAVGNSFARSMFYNCNGAAFTMNEVFNLPQSITTAGDHFAFYMFYECSGAAFTMNDVFNLPQGITVAGFGFASTMFYNCKGAAFTMNEVFNLPQDITTVGTAFSSYMFYGCSGAAFTMNDVFNLPQGITAVGANFAYYMFYNCKGAAFTMNEVFNLPQGITAVGENFADSMLRSCSGNAFTMNEVFNLPQGITTVEESFAYCLFYQAGGTSFQVNDVFRFPVLNPGEVNKESTFWHAFGSLSTNTKTQTRSAQSIINGNETPAAVNYAFSNSTCFVDRPYISTRWGGGGNTTNAVVSFVAWGPNGETPSSIPASQIVKPREDLITKPADPSLTHYVFKGWYKEAACTTEWNFDSDTVTGNTYLYAKWTALHTITVTAGAGGTVSPSTINVEEGLSQEFTITPNEYYAVTDVVVDDESKGVISSFTFENVSGPHTLEVTFNEIYTQNTLTDVASNISASGLFSSAAELSVVKDRLHPAETCAACATIKAKQNAGELYSLHDVTAAGFKPGTTVEVVFPIDAQYNGKEVIIYHCNNGKLEEIPAVVQNAQTKVNLENFSPVGIGKPAADPNPASPGGLSNTGDTPYGIYTLVALLLASGVILLGARRMLK